MRTFAVALFALAFAPTARGADPAPEKLLPPSTQLYVRWDGVTAHADAYKKSVWGGLMAGPTGDTVRALLARVPKLLGASVLADPLLAGKPPAELKANLADLKAAEKLIDLIADKGVIVAAEVREPAPTIKGIGTFVGGLIGGKLPGPEAIMPDAQLIVMVPDVGDKADVLFGTLRLLFKQGEVKILPFEVDGRKGFRLDLPNDGPLPLHTTWWVEGKHFVFYVGTCKPATIISEMQANVVKGGVTNHPLYVRAGKLGDFESITRGFVDTGKLVDMAKALGGPLVPGLKERLDGTGLSGLRAAVFSSGFDGKESRAVYEFDAPGERKGLLKVLKQEPLTVADLPPLPPDVSRFSALRIDPAATYDAGLGLVEFISMNEQLGVEENGKQRTQADIITARTGYMAREVDKFLGITLKDDLLAHLGDKFVLYQSPTEGLQVIGSVVCISVKDAAKVKAAADRIQRALETLANSPVKVRKKVLKGVEYREFYARGFGILTPTYAVVGDWLVIAGHPQAVQGVILRSKGELPKWKPDEATAKRLAKMPAGCGLQYCDPKSTVSNLCTIGPLALSAFGNRNGFGEQTETDFDPIDVGLVPNAHELNKHLFPNLTVTRDDGKTIRIEVNESFSLPLEVIGLEPLAFGLLTGLRF
ncbi:MAG: hypothetical protein FJ304_20500 [Planctomycetes bacterium]|nr:hypothetical protein [Planctomycetota bacterium]